MIHQFYRYDIDLSTYQLRDLPKEIVKYDRSFERSLSTEMKRFQNELHWNEMWTLEDVYRRLESGYYFFVLRPKNQIKGWVWLAPDGEIKNAYVSKWSRNRGWCRYLCTAAMNAAWELEYPTVYGRIDIWNKKSIHSFEQLLTQIGCKIDCKIVEEEYNNEQVRTAKI